jgi:hypothetical protein
MLGYSNKQLASGNKGWGHLYNLKQHGTPSLGVHPYGTCILSACVLSACTSPACTLAQSMPCSGSTSEASFPGWSPLRHVHVRLLP